MKATSSPLRRALVMGPRSAAGHPVHSGPFRAAASLWFPVLGLTSVQRQSDHGALESLSQVTAAPPAPRTAFPPRALPGLGCHRGPVT